MSPRKHRSPELKREIAAVATALYGYWNPIGIAGLPADEYDSYAPGVLSLLHASVDDRTIARHLAMLEARRFSMDPQPLRHLEGVAAQVRSAYRLARGT